ncbi:MAG: alpha/beta fold hydrolase [Gemmatimonadota bacterium]|nr:alpha/beta fold hydrolase [Gemmatimonadota bacterium]
MMRRIQSTALLLLGLALPLPVAAQESSMLYVIVGNDTLSRERFSRTASELSAEMVSPALGFRFRFTVSLDASGLPVRMTNAFWLPTDAESAAARQRATLSFRPDSVIVEIEGGGSQRLGAQTGAFPFINPSFSLMELVVARAIRVGGDRVTVPGFAVRGGQSFGMEVTRLGPDSVLLNIAGAPARLRVDAEGRILGGVVAEQNLRIMRGAATSGSMNSAPPDYAAPAGAPYRAYDVTIQTPMGHTLAGTLTVPNGATASSRVAAVITSTGSGLQDRDEAIPSVSGYRLFRQVADTLSRHGIAVLRMDDRGFGGSGGNPGTATSRDFADDIRAGLAWLRNRPEIDPARLAIVGHSEGGLIAPLVASTDPTLAGIVLLAGPSRTGRRIMEYQQRSAIDRAPGFTETQRDSLRRVSQAATDSLAKTSPWMAEFIDYDPIPTARSVRRTPVLIVHGSTDLQVTADQAPELEAAFKAGGNRDVTMRVFANANHLLIQDLNGDPAQYMSLPDRAVRADILAAVLEWLRGRLR